MFVYCICVVLGIAIRIVTEIGTGIVTESTIEREGETDHAKGDEVVAVTVVPAKNEAAAGRRESMTGENEMTKVMRY